jgi:uncharacterized protein (DUF305 family)
MLKNRDSIVFALIAMISLLLLSACDSGGGPAAPTPSSTTGAAIDPNTGSPSQGTSTALNIKDDVQFIDMMTPHHQLALDMAKLALEHAQHGELKGLANDIILSQQDEINRMSMWRAEIAGATPTSGHAGMSGGASHDQMKDMPGMDVDLKQLAASSNFDRDFIEAMIPHHQSAIDMARAAMPNLKHQPLRDLANDIITTQQAEIDRMRQWQQEWK